jgi:hypothetical protein
MPTAIEREAALTARCTRFAAEYLSHLRIHPLKVLDRLEAIPGTIFQLDIEQAFFEVAKQPLPTEWERKRP